jgi:hypothetical protein
VNGQDSGSQPGSTRSTTTLPSHGPNTPGITSTTPEKAVGSHDARPAKIQDFAALGFDDTATVGVNELNSSCSCHKSLLSVCGVGCEGHTLFRAYQLFWLIQAGTELLPRRLIDRPFVF